MASWAVYLAFHTGREQHEGDDALQPIRAAAPDGDDADREREDEKRAWRARRGRTTIAC